MIGLDVDDCLEGSFVKTDCLLIILAPEVDVSKEDLSLWGIRLFLMLLLDEVKQYVRVCLLSEHRL